MQKKIKFLPSIISMESSENLQLKNLQDNQDMLRFAVEAAGLGTWDLNPETNKFIGNDRLKDWFGLSFDAEIELSDALNCIVPNDKQRVIESIKNALNYVLESDYDIEYTIINQKTNQERIVRAKGKTTFNEAKKPIRFNGILQDVTEQSINQKKRKEDEQRLKLLIDESPMRITFLSGPDFIIQLANEKMLKSWGKDRTILGKAIEEAIPEIKTQNYLKILKEVYQTGKPYTEKEAKVWYKIDGKMKHLYFDLWYKPLFDSDDKVYGILATAVDVTDKVDAQKRIEESERRFKDLIAHASFATCLFTGKDMVVEIANEKMIEIWGKPEEDVIGKPLAEAVPELKGQPFLEILKNVFETGQAYSAVDSEAILEVNGKLGSYYFDFTYKPLFDENGNVYGIMDTAVDVTEKVLNRKKLEESEGRFRSLIAAAPVAIGLFVGRDLVIETPNQTFNDIVGKGDVTGWTLREAMPELITEGQPFLQILDDVYTKGEMFQTFGTQVKIVQNGILTHNYYDFTYTPIFNAEGEVYAILDIAIDVTENVLAMKKIEESEINLRNTIIQAPVAMCILKGSDFIVQIANDRILELWGVAGENAIGKSLFTAIPELEGQGYKEMLSDVYYNGKTIKAYEAAVVLPRETGPETIYVDFVYEAFRESDGSISGIMVVATDVTDQMIARKKIEEAEEKARLAIESGDLGPYEVDLLTDELKSSERFNEIWGIKSGAKRKSLIDSIHPDFTEIREKAHAESLVTGNLDYETRIIKTDETQSWVKIKGKVLFSEDGKPLTLIGVIQDITEQKHFAEELTKQVKERTIELQRSNDDLLQFAHVASHDLKEPVRKIKIFSNMLEQEFSEKLPERAQGYLTKIQNSTDRMFSMIEGVLAYSAVTSSDRPINSIDLNDVIKNIESDLEILIENKDAVIKTAQLPTIEGASVLIYQLFYNLINNALKFAKEDRQSIITIQSELIGDTKNRAKIVVSDNGIGLDPLYIHKIFDVFSRLNAKDQYEGTGLGLALCKKIVQRHHGSIEASGVKGESATFTIYLPVKQEQKII